MDEQGRVCPLCDRKITFSFEGPGVFLGGYNSGKFNGYGRHDSVIHTDHVYAECGNNRVFIRAGKEAGEMVLKAEMEGVPQAEIRVTSVSCDTSALAAEGPQHLTPEYGACAPEVSYGYEAIPEADAAKYVPLDKVYCKVLVNGQEPDTRSILSIVDHGAIYSPILFILERMKSQKPEAFDYSYENKVLTIRSGGHVVQAEVGRTHLLVDGEENLLNGQPYENEDGVFIVEINAVVPYIQGVSSWYDDKINVFRIEW